MQFESTRNNKLNVTSAYAILNGISEDGGLFLPKEIPQFTDDDFKNLKSGNYIERAKIVISKFLTDYTDEELENDIKNAYLFDKFDDNIQTPISKLNDTEYLLELWHGPTCAFKDMALQLLPHLLTDAIRKEGDGSEIIILVATSGDTGKAALEGFKDVAGTKIMVFYPQEGVSQVQKRQMVTQEGSNVNVCAIKGNFDDAQTGVKKIFTNSDIKAILAENNMAFSSANSINWGRLVPQIVYYVSAYFDLLSKGEIKEDEKINIVVPTGNFGNILAAYFAKEMGIPVNKLICASNHNNVLTDFINDGEYDKNRKFYTTMSPSMDILISSNLERLIYLLSNRDSDYTKELMDSLVKVGKYKITDDMKQNLQKIFYGDYATEEETSLAMKECFDKYGYLCDPHTAVAVSVYEKYLKSTNDDTKTVIASTASPFKFVKSVLTAIKDDAVTSENEFDMIDELQSVSGVDAPKQLASLKDKTILFNETCTDATMKDYVLGVLGIK
jgi:threonine synthase